MVVCDWCAKAGAERFKLSIGASEHWRDVCNECFCRIKAAVEDLLKPTMPDLRKLCPSLTPDQETALAGLVSKVREFPTKENRG